MAAAALGEDEVVRIAAGVTVADCADPATWFDARTLPYAVGPVVLRN